MRPMIERLLHAAHRQREHVETVLRRAEPVGAARRFEEGVEVELVVLPRRHEGAEVRQHEQQQHDGEADQREPLAERSLAPDELSGAELASCLSAAEAADVGHAALRPAPAGRAPRRPHRTGTRR